MLALAIRQTNFTMAVELSIVDFEGLVEYFTAVIKF